VKMKQLRRLLEELNDAVSASRYRPPA
jgi:hypothetical protein